MKVKKCTSEGYEGYSFYCPGCGHRHVIYTIWDNKPRWTFNGNIEKPTFIPSLLVTAPGYPEIPRCHTFITDGRIQYLADCGHSLAGQTIDMMDLTEPEQKIELDETQK